MNQKLIEEYRRHRAAGSRAADAIRIARYVPPPILFKLDKWSSDQTIELDDFGLSGYSARVRIEPDYDSSPFDWDCYYRTPESAGYWPYFPHEHKETREVVWLDNGRREYWRYDRAGALAEACRQFRKYHKGMSKGVAFQHAVEAVECEASMWRRWISGDECHSGFVVELQDRNGEQVSDDCCYGFDGAEYCAEEAASALQRLIDYEIERRRDDARNIREQRKANRQRLLAILDGWIDDLGADLCPA